MSKRVLCNLCGSSFSFFDDAQGYSIYKDIGYGSDFDGNKLELDICVGCMDELINKCAINPVTTDEFN